MRKMVRVIMMIIAAALVYLPASASDQEIKGKIINGAPVLILEDGQKLVGELEIKHGVRELLGLAPREMFNTFEDSRTFYPEALAKAQYLRISLPGGYTAVFTFHTGFIGGCIKRTVPHVGFLISKKGQQTPVYDLHIAAWRQGTKICAGVYITPSGWCKTFCSPSFSDITGAIAGALIAAGLVGWLAWAISYILAPIAMAALAL